MMKRLSWVVAAVALLMVGAGRVRADEFLLTFSSATVNGSALLEATDLGGGRFLATSGFGSVTDTSPFTHSGDITLFPNPSPTGAAQSSPSGSFVYNDLLFPGGTQLVDIDGPLFRFADNFEINIFNEGTPTAPEYVYFEQAPGFANTIVTLSLTPVPEPSSLTLLGLAVLGLGGYSWRGRKRTAA